MIVTILNNAFLWIFIGFLTFRVVVFVMKGIKHEEYTYVKRLNYRNETVVVPKAYYSPKDGFKYMLWGPIGTVVVSLYGTGCLLVKAYRFLKSDRFNQSIILNRVFGLK